MWYIDVSDFYNILEEIGINRIYSRRSLFILLQFSCSRIFIDSIVMLDERFDFYYLVFHSNLMFRFVSLIPSCRDTFDIVPLLKRAYFLLHNTTYFRRYIIVLKNKQLVYNSLDQFLIYQYYFHIWPIRGVVSFVEAHSSFFIKIFHHYCHSSVFICLSH